MTVIPRIARAPIAAVELANIVLTAPDAAIAASPREIVWSHRDVTLYRYRSAKRTHPVPVLLVFALINTPAIFDLRPGSSLVEFLLEEGFDVFLLDWGYPDEEDADTGLDDYVCDELHWAVRETLRAAAAKDLTLVGWCMGATLCAMYCGLGPGPAVTTVRNLVLLTMPVDGRRSTYERWVGSPHFDSDRVAEQWRILPGGAVDFANKLLKPVTNFWSTYRRLAEQVVEDRARPDVYQPMARWVGDNPNLPGRAWAQWIQIMYRDGALPAGRVRLRGRRVDLARVHQNLLVITAASDHIAPRDGTMPLFDVVGSRDVTHFDRPGGHIGLVAGSGAKRELWPDIVAWLAEHSD
jgi:polyhydroxyalkanoate synthase